MILLLRWLPEVTIWELLTFMDMKSIFLACLSICLSVILFSREQETRIAGTVYKNDQPALFVRLYLLENTDTINVYETNESGKFSMTSVFCPENSYTLIVSKICNNQKIALYTPGISTHCATSYQLDSLTIFNCCTLKMPATNTYEVNSTKPITQFNLPEIRLLMNEYPAIKLIFFQVASKQDRKRVIRKRMELFEKAMIAGEIPADRLIFPTEKEIPDRYLSGIFKSEPLPYISVQVIFSDK